MHVVPFRRALTPVYICKGEITSLAIPVCFWNLINAAVLNDYVALHDAGSVDALVARRCFPFLFLTNFFFFFLFLCSFNSTDY